MPSFKSTKYLNNDTLFFGLGVDVEKIGRFSKSTLTAKNFLKRIYTSAELKYCLSKKYPAKHLAVRFAAKEAVYKSLASEFSKNSLLYNEIEIINKGKGAPEVKIKNKKFRQYIFVISLSHADTMAIAIVMAWKVYDLYKKSNTK